MLALGGCPTRQLPACAPIHSQGRAIPGPDLAPGAAVGADLHPGEARQVVAGAARKRNGDNILPLAGDELAVAQIQVDVRGRVIYCHLHRVSGSVPQMVVGPRL